ncbi:LuxR C-terminal-related transcriptional regulator [Streptomyces boninensis]|uniref:helix-turn-helix transcriptional regulator n=1 Tax=Streptomyces boninensis TaxID=2039455 RepID=UPI003B214623
MMRGEPPTTARDRDLAELRRQLKLARDPVHPARFVRITGEPFSGKTRLLGQLAATAAHDGWGVAMGCVPRIGGPGSFGVLVDALDEHLARADGTLFERLGARATAALAPHFPALAGSGCGCDCGHRDSAPAGTAHALRSLLELMAQDNGLLLVLDDVHRAGPEVADFLAHLVRHPPDNPVLTVWAHRTPVVRRHLTAVAHDADRVRHLALEPLDAGASAGLLAAGLPPLQRELALRDAAGTPGLLRAVSGGTGPGLYGIQELAAGNPPALTGEPLGLHTLSSLGWRTACAAAVIGAGFSADAVAATAPLPHDDVLRGLDELHAEGLIEPADGAGRFTFARPLVRALVHQAAGAGWRTAAQARAVEELRRADAPDAARELAALLEQAPRLTAQDVRMLALSARDGVFTRPWWSVRALRRIGADPHGPVEARLLLHKALVAAGSLAQAAALYEQVCPHLHEAGSADARAEAAVWHARTLRLAGRPDQARAVLDELADVPYRTAEVTAEAAALALEPGAGADALPAAHRALDAAVADAAAAPGHQATALALLAAARAAAADETGARRAAAAAARRLGPLDDGQLAGHLEALRWLGEAEQAVGAGRAAEEHLSRGVATALDCGQGAVLAVLALPLARVRLAAGHTGRAAAGAELACHAAEQYGSPALAAAARELRGRVQAPAVKGGKQTITTLSGRERQIAELVATGYTNHSIAARLDISTKTVETYMSRIFKKLDANSRAQVAHTMGRNSGGGP